MLEIDYLRDIKEKSEMMDTLELNNLKYTVIEELMTIDNQESLSKIERYIRKIKQALSDTNKEQFKRSLKQDLREALQEVNDINRRKGQALTMDDLYTELEKEK